MSHLVVGFAATVVLARALGAEGFGIYSYALALIALIGIPTQAGLPKLVVRFVSAYDATADLSSLKGLIRWANLVVLALASIALALIIHLSWPSLETGPHSEAQQSLTFIWAALLLPLLSLGALRGAVLRGLRHPILGAAPEMIITRGLLLIAVGTLFMLGHEMLAHHVMGIHVLAAAVSFGIGVWWLWLRLPDLRDVKPRFEYKKWLSVAAPFAATGGVAVLMNKLDVAMLGWLRPASEVGVYSVASQCALLVTLGLSATNIVIGPYVSRFYTQGDMLRLQKLVFYNVAFSLILAIPAAGLLLIAGKQLLVLFFGSTYGEGYSVMVWLTLSQVYNVLVGSVVLVLNMTKHERIVFKGMVLAATLNAILNVLLIPNYGMDGAAVSSLATTVAWNSVLVSQLRRRLNIDCSIIGLTRFAAEGR